MNKKQIEDRIKLEASKVEVPDLKNQILANVPNREVHIKESKKRLNFAVRFTYLTTFAILVLVMVLMLGNQNNTPTDNPNNNTGDNPTQDNEQEVQVSNVKEAYAKQAATLVGFVSDTEIGTQRTAMIVGMSSYTEDYSSIANQINEYFSAVSNLLDEENTTYTQYILSNGEYKYKLVVINKVLENSYETIMYYNESPNNETDEDDLDEVSTTLFGKIERGGKTFTFTGEKEVSEDECKIELIVNVSDTYSIKVEQEVEQEEDGIEKSYEYEFYSLDKEGKKKKIKNVEIEIEEDENGKRDVGVKIDEDYEIHFKYDKQNNQKHVEVDYHDYKEDKDYKGIKIEDDENQKDHYRYDFNDGNDYSVKKPHGHKGHDKDRDDD